jgi:hypothetical protein
LAKRCLAFSLGSLKVICWSGGLGLAMVTQSGSPM